MTGGLFKWVFAYVFGRVESIVAKENTTRLSCNSLFFVLVHSPMSPLKEAPSLEDSVPDGCEVVTEYSGLTISGLM